jgi:3-oxoadipate enol-lactonase
MNSSNARRRKLLHIAATISAISVVVMRNRQAFAVSSAGNMLDASAFNVRWPDVLLQLQTFVASGGILGHLKYGHGSEAVLVMHEWLGDHRNYTDVLPYLSADKYTYVFADLRGYGLSRELMGEFSAREAAIDAFFLMDKLGFRSFHVAGHSMSGMVSQYMLIVDASRIASLTLTSPVPASGFKVDSTALNTLRGVISSDDAARATINDRTGRRYSAQWLERKLEIVRTSATALAMEGYLKMFTQTNFADLVKGSSVRVSAICGDYDVPAYRPSVVKAQLDSLYRPTIVSANHEAGHYSMLETPVVYATLLERHIAGDISKL